MTVNELLTAFCTMVNELTPDEKERALRALFLSCLCKGKEMTHQRVVEQFHTCSGYFKVCEWLKKLGVDE